MKLVVSTMQDHLISEISYKLSQAVGQEIERIDCKSGEKVVVGHYKSHTMMVNMTGTGLWSDWREHEVKEPILTFTLRFQGNRAVGFKVDPREYGQVVDFKTKVKDEYEVEGQRFEFSPDKLYKHLLKGLARAIENDTTQPSIKLNTLRPITSISMDTSIVTYDAKR